MMNFIEKDILKLLNWLPNSQWHWKGFNGVWNSVNCSAYRGFKSKDVLEDYLSSKKYISKSSVFDELIPLVAKLNKISHPGSNPKFELVQKSKGGKITSLMIEVTNLPGYLNITNSKKRILKAISQLGIQKHKIRFISSSHEENSIVNNNFDVTFFDGKMSGKAPAESKSGLGNK